MLKRLAQLLSRHAAAPDRVPDASQRAAQHIEAGNAALQGGQLADAERCYRQALAEDPGHRLARVNLGYVLLERGQASQALAFLEQAIALLQPQDTFLHEARFLAGQAHAQMGRPAQALASYAQALEVRATFEEPLRAGVEILLASAQAEDAVAWIDRVSTRMASPAPKMLRARALHAGGRLDEAIDVLQAVVQHAPEHVGALESLGNLLLEAGRGEEAVQAFRRLHAVGGDTPENVANLAAALVRVGRAEEAVTASADAVERHPQHADLRYTHGLAQLFLGRLPQAWDNYEWRWGSAAFQRLGPPGPQHIPRWRGEPLAGRSILLCAEQGLGDSIQFLRYVPLVAAGAREVFLQLQPPLHPLLQQLPANCRLLSPGEGAPQADWQSTLLSLPAAWRTTLQDIPGPSAIIGVDAQRREHWLARAPRTGAPRVGLVWSGNPGQLNDRYRSIPLQELARLAKLPAQFISLQLEVRQRDREAFSQWPGLLPLGGDFRDFADTAAVIESLDLVIAVDSSVAHLAGALERPLWLLLPFNSDWRWMLDRTDSPWYPSARLYRQAEAGNWDPVLARVEEDLRIFLPGRSPPYQQHHA